MQNVIREANLQKKLLENARPELAETLGGKATLKELVESGEYTLPFNCIFYDESAGSCKIFELRPLLCRAYGSALYPSQNTISHAISKLISFLLLKGLEKDRVLVRRPTPLFYYLSLIFNGETPEDIAMISFCDDIMSLDEEEYIKKLIT